MPTQRKKRFNDGAAQMTPDEALELRLIAYQVTAAEAALRQLVATREVRMVTIAKVHGIDATQGAWHFDADAGRIEPGQPATLTSEAVLPQVAREPK